MTLPLSMAIPLEPIQASLLKGLGKPTKRGIKKCSKCGYHNGTRSMFCKNEQCNVLLKEIEDKEKIDLHAVKLITSSVKQIYSVRVPDMGPECRGFVQLPFVQNDSSGILKDVALCFVDSCQRLFDNSILKCHEEEGQNSTPLCAHLRAALNSNNTATPIPFNFDILQSLVISSNIKESLIQLASDRDNPIVQRVSKYVFAVKCKVSAKHPLGYLHFILSSSKGNSFDKFCCSCLEFTEKQVQSKYKCLHYYACMCTLGGSRKYAQEFINFVKLELVIKNLNDSTNIATKEKPVTYTLTPNDRKPLKRKKGRPEKVCKPKTVKTYKIAPKIIPVEVKVLNDFYESGTHWDFLDWLAYVTESINRTMKFDNCGIMNTLIFDIPESFYQAFKERIPEIYQKSDAFPQRFHIMNILHLKKIFDTPTVKLRISKKFIHTQEKGYVEYEDETKDESNPQMSFIFFLNVGQSTIDESDNTNNPFIIEWIKDTASLVKMGHLKLEYKFGRKST